MTNTIPIFLASDDNYAPFVATTICSIIKNTSDFVDFYILDGGIAENNKQKIELLKKQFPHFSLNYYDMTNAGLERFPNLRHYSLNAFSRYFIPILAPHLDKILYMDVDIIVRGNIAEIYHQDLENYPLGAILEDFYPHNYAHLKRICHSYTGGIDGKKYFNSGVLLIDLKYFRENNLTQKLVEMTVNLRDILSCPDQDIFNLLFDNNFKILDYRFNFMPDHFELFREMYPHNADEVKNNAVVLHYTGGKPWKFDGSCAAEYFWEIAKLTPFYGELRSTLQLQIKKARVKRYKSRIKYCFYKILSKIMTGKIREKYKRKAERLRLASR